MFPKTLALVDPEGAFSSGLTRYLLKLGIAVDVFADGTDLLTCPAPYSFQFYVTEWMLPGVEGTALIKILRQRTNVGVLVVAREVAADSFKRAITGGADMYLAKPEDFEHVALAIMAIQRRIGLNCPGKHKWRLDRRLGQLLAPNGARVGLSGADLALLECFVESGREIVTRETLLARLRKVPALPTAGGLNGFVFRLRRRIERATPIAVPLQTKSGVGYAFEGSLEAI